MSESSIILFDGHCNLCNRWVDFVIKRDPQMKFKFAAQQSEKGRQLLKDKSVNSTSSNSIILIHEQSIFDQSTAVLMIISQLQTPLKYIYFLRFIPRFIRDLFYTIIAKNRYRIFGKREICRVPKPSELNRFI